MVRVFTDGRRDLGSIPGRVIPCLTLSIIRYGSRVKWSNPGKGVVPSPTPQCSSYRKGSLRVTFDYVNQLYLLAYALKQNIYLERTHGHFYTKMQHA